MIVTKAFVIVSVLNKKIKPLELLSQNGSISPTGKNLPNFPSKLPLPRAETVK
jgi:hypothetical protein